MNCLCCGKPLKTDDGTLWHKACIRRFFGTTTLPEIKIDEDTLTALALENTGKGVTVPGVQKKLSLHLLSDTASPRLTLVDYPTGYILKPQVADFEALPQAEHLVMSMADATGIATVPHALICQNGEIAYLTKRIDRRFGENSVELLAMEDFCQLDRRLTEDKYRGSYERCAKVIRQYSSRKQLDLSELFLRLVFSYVVGNSDIHINMKCFFSHTMHLLTASLYEKRCTPSNMPAKGRNKLQKNAFYSVTFAHPISKVFCMIFRQISRRGRLISKNRKFSANH